MLENLPAYCINVVENAYAFLYHFLVRYRHYVVINIAIVVLNLVLLRSVHHYMSKRSHKHPDSLKITKTKFERKSQTQTTRPRRNQVRCNKVPSLKVPRQQTQRANKHPKPTVAASQASKNTGKTTPACHKFLTPPRQVPSPQSGRGQTDVDKCDETLDEITWACDDSHSSLANINNTNQFDSQVQIHSADVRATQSSHVCRRMGKSIDVRDEQQREDEGNTVQQENQQKNNRTRQDGKKRQKNEDSQMRSKSCVQKKKTGKLKQRHRKVSRGVNTPRETPSGQNDADSEEPGKVACTERPPDVNHQVFAHGREKRMSVNEARVRRIRHQQHPSPRIKETVKNSSGDSKNSLEESDQEMVGSDQQFHGNRSESSLVCKRDSWIWFSPEMRPSVEDFAARQRKFRSRDPRVAELAFEISRQEEMNRDIERAAESLIDSSSPSTCKLLEGSLRRSLCGAMKTRASRKSRVTPYIRPDVTKLSMSPVSRLAAGDHVNKDDNEYNEGQEGKGLSSDVMKILPTGIQTDKHTEKIKDSRTPTPKRRKTRQKISNLQTTSLNHIVVCAEPRTASPASSEHSKHNEAELNSVEGESLPRSINWYNSPAASAIRRLYTPSRYSPLYDNTTLVCSTQCSLCSLVSSSMENTKATGNHEKNRAAKSEECNEREGLTVHSGQPSSPVEIKGCPGETNLPATNHVNGQRVTSSTRRQYYKEVPASSVMSKEGGESGPESPCDVEEKYTNRLSPKWRSSKSSPRKRRFSDCMVSITNRSNPENRKESYKYARRSPQLTFSTGESESDSLYREKSVGPDASYRQCMISKEVNTTVQRLLFDTEKSSSSHSPSSRSRVQFPDLNTDEDCKKMLKHDHKNIKDIAHLRESCTRINISRDSPPQILEPEGSKQDSGSDKHSSGSHDGQLLGVMNPETSFISSDSQTCCACHRMTHKFTNIYARDYYLGKRVTMKKQMDVKASVHSTKWKKLDITWCANSPCHSRSLHKKSRLYAPRRDCRGSARESLKHKPGVKMLAYASGHSHGFHSSVGCQVGQKISGTSQHNCLKDNLALGTKGDAEMNRNPCKFSKMNASRSLQPEDYKVCNKPKVGFSQPCDKKSPFRKSSCQLDNPVLSESSVMSPSKKPYIPLRPAASVHRCKKEGGAQNEPSTLLATASTNNSSNNLSYCSHKSTSFEKPSLFSKTAQFYFVMGATRSPENSSYQRHGLGYVELSKDANADMFKNSQIPGALLKSSIATEPDIAVINCDTKSGHDPEVKERTPTASATNPGMSALFTASGMCNYKTDVTSERFNLPGTIVFDKHQMYPVVRSNRTSQESIGMNYSNENTTISTTLPLSFNTEGDNSCQGRVMAAEDGCPSNCEELKPFDADTGDADHCNLVTPVLASAVKQGSNPDSGYDESLSEKANGDCSFQVSLATAVDLSRTGSSPQWFKQHVCNLQHHDTKSCSTSPLSDASRNSDHAHRSHMSNDCDSEQDTLPSLSDDTFHTSSNFDPIIHTSPDTSRCAQNADSILFTNDVPRQGSYQDSSFNKLTGPNDDIVSPQSLNKAIGKTIVDPDWTTRYTTQHETVGTGNTVKLLSDSNQLFPTESDWNAIEGMVGCHSAIIPVPPASIENVYTEDCREMTHGPKVTLEERSYNADFNYTADKTPDQFLAQMLNVFHPKAKFSETDLLETLTQANSKLTWSGRMTHTPKPGAPLSTALCKSAGNPELFESKASNLAQSDEGIEYIWSTAAQTVQGRLTSSPTFNWQDSKETYQTHWLETPLTTNTVLNWLPLDGANPAESTMGVAGKELEASQQCKASSAEGKSHLKTIHSPCRLTISTTDIPEDELPQSITLPPTSSDEEDAAGGDCCYDILAHTPGSKTNNSTRDYWARETAKPPSTENGTFDPAWRCNSDNSDNILSRKPHQNKYKQSANRHLSQQANKKVLISDRSIQFSEILKRF